MVEPISASTIATISNKTIIESGLKEGFETTLRSGGLENQISIIKNQNLESCKVLRETFLEERFEKLKFSSPLYENHLQRLKWIEKFDNVIGEVPGYLETRVKTLSENVHSARGSFAELARAYRIQESGLSVKGIGKDVHTNFGKTDIDILAESKDGRNIWIENKDVQNISCDKDFGLKIAKMEDGLKNGVVDKEGNKIKIDEAIFVNKGNITQEAIEYAKSKGIHIKDKMDGRAFQKYIQRV